MKVSLISLSLILPVVALADRPMSELPMYNGQHVPSEKRNPELSKDAAKRGWSSYYRGELDTAMKRFNQAWTFDQNNPEVYWAFGLIMGQRASQEETEKNLKESIRFLQMAVDRDRENGRILGDLAFSHTLLGHYLHSVGSEGNGNFEKARKLFPAAFKLDAKHPPIVANWSVFYFYTQDFKAAKSKADEAIEMGYKFSPEYLKDLESKLK